MTRTLRPHPHKRALAVSLAVMFLAVVSMYVVQRSSTRRIQADEAGIAPTRHRTDPKRIVRQFPHLTPAQTQTLYATLINHYWVPQTGLFLSFPRTGDIRLVQQAATYDQGIIGLLLLKLGQLDQAGKIVSFYEKAWESAAWRSGPREGVYGLANFYNAFFSVEGIEKTMHVGPNAWIGLLASRYARQTGDAKAQALALQIARWMIKKVPHSDGAIAMGQIPWNSAPWHKIYSTENNLSTYAFLNDLLKNERLSASDRQMLTDERDHIGRWLIQKAYQPGTQSIIRGFHPFGVDRAGAIDSYTWMVNALGPKALESEGISPDALMQRAKTEFTVNVGPHIGVDAVDAAMAQATYEDAVKTHYKDVNFLRPAGNGHRLIWYEGTGQYVVALEDMARYKAEAALKTSEAPRRIALQRESNAYLKEAKAYIDAMDRAVQNTPEGTFYPCATSGRFYLYGWPAPQPIDGHLADASAALTWRLFAGMGYNPLTDTWLGPHQEWKAKPFAWKAVRNPGTAILYGASEEMMVQAWTLYEKGDKDGAWRQAKATISVWEEDARKLQKIKEEEVGTFLGYDGTVDSFQNIHNYWALNDVASCYFVLAKIADEQKNYADAREFLSTILRHYHLAQMWDKRGWFWNPVDTIQQDFVDAQPETYGTLADLIPREEDKGELRPMVASNPPLGKAPFPVQ